LTGPAPAVTTVVASSVTIDAATGTIATFTPENPLAQGTYAATIVGGPTGVLDLAVPADDMVADYPWTFTAGAATGNCLAPVALGSASPYGDFGGTAGMTNTGTLTVINGDTGSIATGTSSITGFHDTAGDIYTQTPANIGAVNGTIYTCTNSTTGPTSTGPNAANCKLATDALGDATIAYLALVHMPPGADPGVNLAGQTLTPGVYTAPGGSFLIQGGNLTLNAEGNANAVFVFQMADALTVGGPGVAAPQSVILSGGALAQNVFWQVGSFATINAGGGGTMVGTIISQTGMSFSTAGNVNPVTLNGRALSLGASVTLVDTVINVPPQ
jgi:Ice-binding-like